MGRLTAMSRHHLLFHGQRPDDAPKGTHRDLLPHSGSSRPPAGKIAVLHAFELFRENSFDPSLSNYGVVGGMAGKRAFSADHDLRIVFVERGNRHDVTLLYVGGHAEVYRR
jgi:mRNA-degrading endonuclease YafQ of YafQ-DinJ toxin-antitoxin module